MPHGWRPHLGLPAVPSSVFQATQATDSPGVPLESCGELRTTSSDRCASRRTADHDVAKTPNNAQILPLRNGMGPCQSCPYIKSRCPGCLSCARALGPPRNISPDSPHTERLQRPHNPSYTPTFSAEKPSAVKMLLQLSLLALFSSQAAAEGGYALNTPSPSSH